MNSRHGASRGFTLIEILVTLVLIATLLGLAAPSFVRFQRNSELTTQANNFLATLNTARAEAMKRQLTVFVVPQSNNDWTTGWTAYVDANNNQTFDTGDTVVAQEGALAGSVVVENIATYTGFSDGTSRYVRFSGSGYPVLNSGGFNGGALQLGNGTESRRIVMNVVGRMRVCKPSEATCTATGF